MNTNKAFAEVIESSLTGFLAQSWQWDTFPAFGSLVTVEYKKRTVIAVVHQVQTGSMDPVRYPFPYKKTEEELRTEQPQIFEFLKTTFSCLVLGYKEGGQLFYLLAPEPVRIHAFVEPASIELSKQFFYVPHYLHILFGMASQLFNMEELLLALLKKHHELNILSQDTLNDFIQTYSLLTGNEYRRLKLFLQRIEPLVRDQAVR